MKARRSGFTLIEILIVVIILGILAAIVIPQFTEASSEARESTLVSNLHTLRSQIGLYKVQHNDLYPGDTDGDFTTIDVAAADLVTDIEGQTDIDGNAGTDFGPYMQNIPDNPFIPDPDAVPLFSVGNGAAPADNSSHWYFDNDTGNIWANDDGANADGVAHSTL
jgi:general secretion pathway protein G